MNTLKIPEIENHATAPRTSQPPAERFYSLDALRAFVLLLGVVFHSLMAYVLPSGFWAVGTTKPPTPLLWFVYYVHSFRMEVFFLLAGFFTCMVIEKRGVASFLRDRAKRILLVFVVALYPMKLLLSSAWISGGFKTGWLKLPPEVAKLPIWQLAMGGLGRESWPNINLTHLWFLYCLACVTCVFLAVRWLIVKWIVRSEKLPRALDAGFRWLTSNRFAPLYLTVVATPLLATMSGADVDTPDKGFAPNFPVLLLYTLFFCFGWWLHRQAELFDTLARRWKSFLPLSLLVSVIASIGVGMRLSGAEHGTGLRWATSFGTSLTMSLAVLGWLGLFVRMCNRASAWVRYLADSSYWVYLAHLPVVVALQILFSDWQAPLWIKLLAINVIAFAVLLSTYHLCVRFTWIGAWLNGRRATRLSNAPLLQRAVVVLVLFLAPASVFAQESLRKVSVGDGVELNYIERGKGVPIVFVHGTLGDYSTCEGQLGVFGEKYRALAYSRRYNYPNSNILRPNHSAIVEAEDLAAFIKKLDLGRVHVIGHSYGGYTALFMAIKHPELVRTLTVSEPPVVFAGDALDETKRRVARRARTAFEKGDTEGAVRAIIDSTREGAYDKIPEACRPLLLRNAEELRALVTSDDMYPRLDRAIVRKIAVPTLLLSGEKSTPSLKSATAELERLLPEKLRKHVVITDADHGMWFQQPDACRNAVFEFLHGK